MVRYSGRNGRSHSPVRARSYRGRKYVVCLLVCAAVATLSLQMKYFCAQDFPHDENRSSLRTLRNGWVSESSQPFNDGNRAANAKHLIIVAGHSVAISGHLEDAGRDETDWYLLPYQKNRGLPAAIVGHINTGLNAANEDEQSLLIFSGGETRASTGPETEGASYYRVADAMNLWPENSSVRARTISEEFATDSFENL
jgi:hypothetical protein